MRIAVFLMAFAGGCGHVATVAPDGAPPDPDGPVDAAPGAACDVHKPFGPPVPVPGINTTGYESWGWMSDDQLTIYFDHRIATNATDDLYIATRSAPTTSFTAGAPLTGDVNTADDEQRPTLTGDGLFLFLEATAAGGLSHIHVASRGNAAAQFSSHAAVDNVNSASTDRNPWISDDGLVLYFSTDRTGNFDIYKATRSSRNTPFGPPAGVGELNDAFWEGAPVLSRDGLEIFLQSDRDHPNERSIYHATRSTPTDGFGAMTQLDEVSTANDEYPNWISPDRCILVFSSDRPVSGTGAAADYNIWMATRPK